MAISESSYAVGNRIYRGASSAPTRGTVDPMGYIERSLMDSRSGLAEAALRRLQPGAQQSSPSGATPQSAGYGTPAPAPAQYGGAFLAPRPITAPAVSMTGKISTAGIPYEAGAADSMERLFDERNNAMMQLLQKEQQTNRDYVVQARDVDRARPDMLRNLLNSFAGRGMARSSGYGMGVGQVENQVANLLAELMQKRTGALNQVAEGRRDTERGYNLGLTEAQKAAVRRLAQQAGTLGLGGR